MHSSYCHPPPILLTIIFFLRYELPRYVHSESADDDFGSAGGVATTAGQGGFGSGSQSRSQSRTGSRVSGSTGNNALSSMNGRSNQGRNSRQPTQKSAAAGAGAGATTAGSSRLTTTTTRGVPAADAKNESAAASSSLSPSSNTREPVATTATNGQRPRSRENTATKSPVDDAEKARRRLAAFLGSDLATPKWKQPSEQGGAGVLLVGEIDPKIAAGAVKEAHLGPAAKKEAERRRLAGVGGRAAAVAARDTFGSHHSDFVGNNVSTEMKGYLAQTLESNLGTGTWRDEVGSTLAAPLDALSVYAPRKAMLGVPHVSQALPQLPDPTASQVMAAARSTEDATAAAGKAAELATLNPHHQPSSSRSSSPARDRNNAGLKAAVEVIEAATAPTSADVAGASKDNNSTHRRSSTPLQIVGGGPSERDRSGSRSSGSSRSSPRRPRSQPTSTHNNDHFIGDYEAKEDGEAKPLPAWMTEGNAVGDDNKAASENVLVQANNGANGGRKQHKAEALEEGEEDKNEEKRDELVKAALARHLVAVKAADAKTPGLTHTTSLQAEVPHVVMLRRQADLAKESGNFKQALKLYEEASKALLQGGFASSSSSASSSRPRGKPVNANAKLFAFHGDAHEHARRIQVHARRRVQTRIRAAVRIAAAFRGFRCRYTRILASRRNAVSQRKVARAYRGRLAQLLPYRVALQAGCRGRLGRKKATLQALWMRRLTRVQARYRAKVASRWTAWRRYVNGASTVISSNWRGYTVRLVRGRMIMAAHSYLSACATTISRLMRGHLGRLDGATLRQAVVMAETARRQRELAAVNAAVELARLRAEAYLETPEGKWEAHRDAIALSAHERRKEQELELLKEEPELQERARTLDVFSGFDNDGSGAISVDELGHLLTELGLSSLAKSRAELEFLVREMDEDGSGEIDFNEFWAW